MFVLTAFAYMYQLLTDKNLQSAGIFNLHISTFLARDLCWKFPQLHIRAFQRLSTGVSLISGRDCYKSVFA